MNTAALGHRPYDPATYVYWVCWKNRCFEASGEDFQRLFEKVIKRARPEFMAIRPYGNLGDRKCDGLFFYEGVVFQVYSPDELTQAELTAKIEEDLAGAVAHWKKQLRRWVFVYNVRRGLPPDVPSVLARLQGNYPDVYLDSLSSDALWEMLRGLPQQQLAEILGPPPGFEQAFIMPASIPDETLERLRQGRFVVIQDVMSPINLQGAIEALLPERPIGSPIMVRPVPEGDLWNVAAEYQKQIVDEALEKGRELLPRFAVFSLAPIPLAIHLGFLLSDRVEVRLFQYDRDYCSWTWDDARAVEADNKFRVSGLPEQPIQTSTEVVLRVSLSDRISPRDTAEVVPGEPVQVDIAVADPDVMWLRSPGQLVDLGRVFREVLKKVRQAVPDCPRIHLFYAGPTGGAITLGRAINPRMNPSVLLYQFARQAKPRYRHVLTLADG